MPTATAPALVVPGFVPVDLYLRTRYRPDREYVRGRIEKRNLGTYDHNSVQKAILLIFSQLDKARGTRTIQEQRTRMAADVYRVPDICVVPRSRPIEQIFTLPQLVAIEVLSPKDRRARLQERIDDYRSFGIPHIWVIDPKRKTGWDCSSGNWVETERFAVEGWDITLSLPEFFAQMAEDEA